MKNKLMQLTLIVLMFVSYAAIDAVHVGGGHPGGGGGHHMASHSGGYGQHGRVGPHHDGYGHRGYGYRGRGIGYGGAIGLPFLGGVYVGAGVGDDYDDGDDVIVEEEAW